MRVLISTTPGWGHIHPVMPLARALMDRGDDVLWSTSADSCELLEREGVPSAAAGVSASTAIIEFNRRFPEVQALPPPERPVLMFPKLFGAVRAPSTLPELLPVVAGWAPDLVICDQAEFAGHVAAAVCGIPSLTHAFGSLIPEARVAAAGVEVAPLWSEQGLDPRPYGGSYENLYLDIYPPSLQSQERRHVPTSQALRPVTYATPGGEGLPGWVTEPSSVPLVYATLGTVFGDEAILSAVVRGASALPIRVVATVGPRGDPDQLGPQPDNVHVARYVPHDALLPFCAAVISHGGSGTFLAALAAGLPQLCLPQAADQFLNAEACASAGAGLALAQGEVTAEAVRDAVKQLVADGPMRLAAATLRDEIKEMPSPKDVAARLHADFGSR